MNDQSQQTVLRWWQGMKLSPSELKKYHIPPLPSSYSAQLRRCDTVDAVMFTEGFRALWLKFDKVVTEGTYADQKMEAWAVIAASLVHVQKDNKQNFAFLAGRRIDGEKPVVSELRFSQLQNSKTADEFLRRMRRILKQLNGEVSVKDLSKDIEQWFFEHNQFRPRKADKRTSVRWAIDYYRAAVQKK